MKYFDRKKIIFKSLSERKNKVNILKDCIETGQKSSLKEENKEIIIKIAKDIKYARKNKRPVIMAFGAHAIKNGLSLVMMKLIEGGYITHLATNGAGIIHDWEFSYLGSSSEDVRENVSKGEFGIWEETTFYLNLAIVVGANLSLGYGESVGKLISDDGLYIKGEDDLKKEILESMSKNYSLGASSLDLLEKIKYFNLEEGFMEVIHKYKKYSVQSFAYKSNVPFTAHPMFGHDIIYTNPMSSGGAIGRAAERDFLSFAKSVSELEGGVYLSLGSAVMSPMIFEKSLSMARNVAIREDKDIKNFSIYVIDLQESSWDWSEGEPDMKNPAYYLRYMKTFSRMGGNVQYISENNVDFLLSLYQTIIK